MKSKTGTIITEKEKITEMKGIHWRALPLQEG